MPGRSAATQPARRTISNAPRNDARMRNLGLFAEVRLHARRRRHMIGVVRQGPALPSPALLLSDAVGRVVRPLRRFRFERPGIVDASCQAQDAQDQYMAHLYSSCRLVFAEVLSVAPLSYIPYRPPHPSYLTRGRAFPS